jgi:site-specific recombinase XerC
MNDYQTAQSAVFWAKVAVERIAKRDINDRITQWATHVALELEGICG